MKNKEEEDKDEEDEGGRFFSHIMCAYETDTSPVELHLEFLDNHDPTNRGPAATAGSVRHRQTFRLSPSSLPVNPFPTLRRVRSGGLSTRPVQQQYPGWHGYRTDPWRPLYADSRGGGTLNPPFRDPLRKQQLLH